MWYYKKTNKVFETFSEICNEFPQISFPSSNVEPEIAALGFEKIQRSPIPEFNSIKETVELGSPKKQKNKWIQEWEIRELSPSEIYEERSKFSKLAVDVKLDLLSRCLLDDLEEWIDKQSREMKIEYDGTLVWNRNWHIINKFAEEIGIDDHILDNVFQEPKTVTIK